MVNVKGKITKVVKEPLTTVKKGLKGAIKPATSEGTGAVMVGAILSAPIGYLYSKGWDFISPKLPAVMRNGILGKVIKFALPLVPIYFVKQFKVPFGNLINGTLLGVFVMQIVMEIWSLVKGGSGAIVPDGTSGNAIELDASNGFAEWT